MNNKIEIYNLNRRKMVIGSIIGFGIWQGTRTFISLFPNVESAKSIHHTIIFIGLIGWGYWSFYLFKMLKVSRELKQNPVLAEALNDEFYQYIRTKSFAFAFWIVMIIQCVIFFVNMFHPLAVDAIFNLNILTGVLSSLLAFIIFDGEQTDE